MEVAVGTWVVAVSVVAESMAVEATAEALAATTVDTAAEVTEAVIAAARIPVDMQAEAPLLPDLGLGKAKAQPGTHLPVGMDSLGITAR